MTLLGFLASSGTAVFGEEASTEVIDKTNWEKIEGLVPDPLLEWVKNGEFILRVDDLDYDPVEYWPPFVPESRTANIGKYALDENDVIVDAKTGELARSVVGIPFPKVDPADPKAATKIIYNKHYVSFNAGNKRFTTNIGWVGPSGVERYVEGFFIEAYLTGFPGAQKYPNPKDMERYNIITVRKPYDLSGTSVMLWRYLSSRQDVNFSYIPAIRRVRRMTPANRSDGFLGSDFTQDDMAGYDGKTPAFEWKVIGEQEVLAPFAFTHPVQMTRTKKEEWMMDRGVEAIRYAFEEKDTTVAAWCPMNTVYVKRPVWLIEARAIDPYYNYGIQYLWIDKEVWAPWYKVIHTRAEKFWKFLLVTGIGMESADKKDRIMLAVDHLIVDSTRNHATYTQQVSPTAILTMFADLELNDFTLGGFQKYCK
jgi:hypothetical protein